MTDPPGHVPPPPGYYPQEAYYAPGWGPPDAQPGPPRRRWGRVLLVVLLAVVGVLVLGAAVVGLVFWRDLRPLGTVEEPVTATVRQLDVGHCLESLPPDGEVLRVAVVPCDLPHTAEVIGTLEIRDEVWPGQDDVVAQVRDTCEMDRTQSEGGFAPVVWAPSEASWAQGDRLGLCLAWSPSGMVTGSFTAGDDVG